MKHKPTKASANSGWPDIPQDIGLWSVLVGGVRDIERHHDRHGSQNQQFHATLANIGRRVPIALKWVHDHGRVVASGDTKRWTPELARHVEAALSTARAYSVFVACYPMWHRDRTAAALLDPSTARFTIPGKSRDLQVRAYQNGIRPPAAPSASAEAEGRRATERLQELFASTARWSSPVGRLAFEYPAPWDLWRELLSEHRTALTALSRRSGALSLGPYTLREFTDVCAALVSVCAAHEFLCFDWGRNHEVYPLESAVIVRTRSAWIAVLAELSGIPSTKCETIVDDLTFDFTADFGYTDLHVHPFIALDSNPAELAIAPQFPLHARHDENILRICSQVRRDAFSATALAKEADMRAALESRSSLPLGGPISLPRPLPDIDLVVVDDTSSTVVIAEMKWFRKSIRPVESIAHDNGVLKGIDQIRKIREFLRTHPNYLQSRGILSKPLSAYERVHYLAIARDHWLWIEPSEDVAIVEFDAFAAALSQRDTLESTIRELLKYEWLPAQGRDFTVQFDRATINDVAVEAETFYAARPPGFDLTR